MMESMDNYVRQIEDFCNDSGPWNNTKDVSEIVEF
jgi:hypothetical protein